MESAVRVTRKKASEIVIGDVFGRLQVIGTLTAPDAKYRRHVECRCSCGVVKMVDAYNLVKGDIKSCGCLVAEYRRTQKTQLKHGMERTRVYRIWAGMKSRCLNPNHHAWASYGGRGIAVCERWMSFENFLDDMGEPLPSQSIDRIDNDGNYEPRNCRWADGSTQSQNRRSTRHIEVFGERLSLAEASERFKLTPKIISARIDKGWTVEDAVRTPKVKKTDPKVNRRIAK